MKNYRIILFLIHSILPFIMVFRRCELIKNYNDLWILSTLVVGIIAILKEIQNGKETKSN